MHLPRFVEGCSVLMHGHGMGFSSQALRQACCRIAMRVSARHCSRVWQRADTSCMCPACSTATRAWA